MSISICIVTATRAEYNLLKPLIRIISEDENFDLYLVVTGAHLSATFGYTYKEIEEDGFSIDKKIDILMDSDSAASVSKTMGMTMISFSDYFAERNMDAIVLLGDRYETLAVACAAMNARIPIVHLYGGETTEGAIDEGIRHAITKLSYLHMTSTNEYRKRVIQLGEDPSRVFNVGALGVENVLHTNLLSKDELEKELKVIALKEGFGDMVNLSKPYGVVTFHPVTLEENTAEHQVEELLSVLVSHSEMEFIITKSNADAGGRRINSLLDAYGMKYKNLHVFTSLGLIRYLSAINYCAMVIGNSSSGIIEAPSFGVPTVNIGDRQKGRIRADSIIDCNPNSKSIDAAMKKALSKDFCKVAKNCNSPFGDGNTSKRIVEEIKRIFTSSSVDLKKKFYDL
ncbi:MAG: UDP-N-acetylglucosamine 2-epimerase (hydrolyzing) [Lachnospiraceae bacterium]|nr:UDP-N-acetylglucosamine 2-epimerase (hydrolyzing) [Lachnospiraceae bacterium]